jgi:hypothetical protein
MKRDWGTFSPTITAVANISDEDFKELCLAAGLLATLKDYPEIILIGGTDLAFFEGLVRTSDDLDFKTTASLDANAIMGSIARHLPSLIPGATVEVIRSYSRLKDKAAARVTHGSKTNSISCNTLGIPSKTARPRTVRVLNREAIVFRESMEERWIKKTTALEPRLFRPLLKNQPMDLRTRDVYDLDFLRKRISVSTTAKLLERDYPEIDLQETAGKITAVRKSLAKALRAEMLELLDTKTEFNADACIDGALAGFEAVMEALGHEPR